jgi:hypothetical protein
VARATADNDEADTGRVSVRGLAVCTIADLAPEARAAGAFTEPYGIRVGFTRIGPTWDGAPSA